MPVTTDAGGSSPQRQVRVLSGLRCGLHRDSQVDAEAPAFMPELPALARRRGGD